MTYFSFDPNGFGLLFHDTADEAREVAERCLDEERDQADSTWPENIGEICYGKVIGKAEGQSTGAAVDFSIVVERGEG